MCAQVKTLDLNSYTIKELRELCSQNGIAGNGSREVMIARLGHFFQTGELLRSKLNATKIINASTILERDFEMDIAQRRFFEGKVGESFRLLAPLHVWIRNNLGRRTYGEALDVYRGLVGQIRKGNGKPYGSRDTYLYLCYVRDFFLNNPDLGIAEANRCWAKRKGNGYRNSDLVALESGK